MKSYFKLLFLIPLLSIAACGNGNSSSELSLSNDSSVNEMSESIVESEESFEDEESSQEKQYPPSVLNSKWGLDAAKASYDALGVAIPYIECDSFDYVPGVDDFGDPDIWFYCYFATDELCEKAFNQYIEICASHGYSGEVTTQRYVDYETFTYIEYDICIVDRVILDTHGIELQFLCSTWEGKPCLGIWGFTYLYLPDNAFPKAAVDELYGPENDIPVIEAEGAEYWFQFFLDDTRGAKCLEIQIYSTDITLEERLFNALIETGNYIINYTNDFSSEVYTVKEYPGWEYGNYFYAFKNGCSLLFCYDFDYGALIIDLFPY